MIVEFFIFIITVVIAYGLYNYYDNHSYFKKHGINFMPGVPLFGNTLKSSLSLMNMIHELDEIYKAFPEDRYIGLVQMTARTIAIRDPELIKQVTVKDFDYFTDHRQIFSDPLFSESLFSMQGEKWRHMRSTLSPAFTGSKMRKMVPFMCQTSHNIVEHLKETEGQNINVGELIRRYTNDVIASTAFGIEVNSVKDQKNRFYEYGQKIINFSSVQKAKIFLSVVFPKCGFQIFPKDSLDFFKHIVTSTMEYREKNNVERPDMIQLLMEASKGTLDGPTEDKSDTVGFATTELTAVKPKGEVQKWSTDQLAAQAFIFFLAGFDSTASVLVMAFHELALNPEVQETLYQEVKEHHEKHGTVTYDGVPTLKYLDGVLNETLRKWPPTLILDRVCQKPYTLPPPREGGKPYTVKEGEVIFNFVNSLHMDEKYYPEPEKFKPERFSDENKQNIKLSAFIPFGSGPRSCIASRFAILELKVLLYYVSLNFILQKCEKTRDPIELTPGEFQVRCIGGSWVKFQARK